LGRLAGNEKMYRKLLRVFYNDKSETCSEIRDALAGGDTSEAQALVHGIKGVAGNLSANRLFEVSSALEVALKDGNTEGTDALMDDFEKAHSDAMGSLTAFFNENAFEQPAGK
jgi:HPt (histidine-containing phosphotransfer) domain-containing protein